MAGSFKDATENSVLDHIVSKTSYTMPTTCAVGLYTAAPTDSTTGTEVTNANAYARKDTAGTDWNAASGGSISNVNDLAFPQATGSWGTVVAFATSDNATYGGGSQIVWGDLTASKAIGNGDTAKFAGNAPGDLVITLD